MKTSVTLRAKCLEMTITNQALRTAFAWSKLKYERKGYPVSNVLILNINHSVITGQYLIMQIHIETPRKQTNSFSWPTRSSTQW